MTSALGGCGDTSHGERLRNTGRGLRRASECYAPRWQLALCPFVRFEIKPHLMLIRTFRVIAGQFFADTVNLNQRGNVLLLHLTVLHG